jgi:Concanavalin A-like lectin/glucanases superfamily/Calcineurin-like phosphoesterase
MQQQLSWKFSLFVICILTLNIFAAPPFQRTDALAFGGAGDYVTFGTPSQLGFSSFTIETWFRRTGIGQPAFTGNGGLSAIPLVTKGRGEDDGSTVDMNYFLGIDNATGVLVADFEDKPSGGNHPLRGVTQLRYNTWYHATVSYNGQIFRLYLNGILEAEINVGLPARNDSIQHAALASALDSTGTPDGYFNGTLDEVRLWNYARPATQIIDGMRQQMASTNGLIARWSLNDGSGTKITDATGRNLNGTLRGSGSLWTSGVNFAGNQIPVTAALNSPSNNSVNVTRNPNLSVVVSDPENDNLIVTYYGKIAGTTGANFSMIALPDTQYYSSNLNGGTSAMFTTQTQWIVNQRAARNIGYVAHLGDCVEHGDVVSEWVNADNSMKLLENPLTTNLLDGIPFGVAVGNHDQAPIGNPTGASTKLFNQYFGTSRYFKRSYYGGRYGSNLDNQYQLFSAGGMDFITIYLEFDESPDAAILSWANDLLKTYNTRRAIVVSHYLLKLDGSFSAQGLATYEALKPNANLFLMLTGHVPGEARRQDVFNGNTVFTLLSDFQNLPNGGDGWLRILGFSPVSNQIRIQTFSPTKNIFDQTVVSQFILNYNQEDSGFSVIKANPNVASGTTTTTNWTGLQPNTEYEWYVTVSDGLNTKVSPHWRFKTGLN